MFWLKEKYNYYKLLRDIIYFPKWDMITSQISVDFIIALRL